MKIPGIKTLDRYLLREFFSPLLLIIIGFAGLMTMVELVDNLRDFRQWNAPLHLILAYRLCKFPLLVVQVTPVAVMLSTLIALGTLARNSELAAMMSGGISVTRIARPLLWASLAIWGIQFGLAELLVPFATDEALYIQKVLVQHRPGPWGIASRERIAMSLSGDKQIYTERMDAEKAEMTSVLLLEKKDGRLARRLDAAYGRYVDGEWVFYRGVLREFDGKGMEVSVEPFVQRPWFIQEKPTDFMIESNQRDEDLLQLSIAQLASIIRVLKVTGAEYNKQLVCLHVRISYPFSCFVLALLGVTLPFLFPYGQRAVVGAAVGLLVSLTSGMVYLILIQVGLSLGKSGILPAIPAAWLGNVVFLGVGLAALRKAAR